MKHDALSLASEFPAATHAEWLKLVDGVLKGAPFDKKLVGHTRDGIAIQPLQARRAHAPVISGARGAAPWKIVAKLDHPDAREANRLALEDLTGGADSLSIAFADAPSARGFGLSNSDAKTLDTALAGIHCDLIAIRLEPGPQAREHALAFAHWLKAKRYVPASLNVQFALSPHEDAVANAATIRALNAMGFTGPFIACDSREAHDAGASEGEELAFVLAAAVQTLRSLTQAGLSLDGARDALSFTLAADQDQVLGIAKFRAFRLLWRRVEEACGLSPKPLFIHAETAWRMSTRRDPYVNVLRATIATFAAGIGGADSIAVLPFTAALGLADGFARRIARNTNLVLLEECNLYRVIDPASGAGSIEALTDDVCTAAWRNFQEIESQTSGGLKGLAAALANGSFAGKIATTQAARLKDLVTRRQAMTGISEFPNVSEAPVEVLAPIPDTMPQAVLPALRLAEPFETLRDRADALAQAGHPVRIFLANLGRIPDFNARATFAKNAFEAGGIAAIGNDGFHDGTSTDLVLMTDAFKASGAHLACLCSSDALYADEAQDAAMALIASGAEGVFLAGKPGDLEAGLRAAGVSNFVFAGMDLVQFLTPLLGAANASRS